MLLPLRDDFDPLDFRAVDGFLAAVDFRAVPAFVADDLDAVAPVDLARLVEAFLAPPVERLLDVDFALDVRLPPVLDVLARAPEEPLREPLLAEPSKLQRPLITRSAASATASAINEPNLVALETTLLAARSAVSAASSPASRIFLRAAGLALIAAAAAARPAASISLLIAALEILSKVSLPPVFFEDFLEVVEPREPVEPLRTDLAMPKSPSVAGKTLQSCSGSLMKLQRGAKRGA